MELGHVRWGAVEVCYEPYDGGAGSIDTHNASNLHPRDNLLADNTCLLHSYFTIRLLKSHQSLMHPLTVTLSFYTTSHLSIENEIQWESFK